ncbi:phospholipid phosphatase-related protein type 5-like [Anneissia japonica]|uniref:phospholipid phosphatase-related protein type 5-like n=1 Tax=Anneissia japonica TaxID=1529436 RepID=UPI0014257108|nr:phospholipid phosphatase-related protein type 5-like [Anneissia japonica]
MKEISSRFQPTETKNNKLIPCFFLLDCVVAVAVILFWYFLYYDEDVFTINSFYVHCSDNSYKYPIQSATVSETTLYVVSLIVPPVLIVFFEVISSEYNRRKDGFPKEKTVITIGIKIKPTIRRIFRYVGLFIVGAFSTLIFTGIGRVIVGRPAPHFFTACPNLLLDCTDYVKYSADVCPNVTELTRSSFPSYFAALSSYAAFFGGIYLSEMMTITSARTLRPVFFAGIVLLPFMVCLDRVANHQEHWTDVIGGCVIGIFIAAYMSVYVLNSFKGSLERAKTNLPLTNRDILKPQKLKNDQYNGGGIMQTLTRGVSRASSRQASRQASRREKDYDFMSRMYNRYNTAHRSYNDNHMDDHRQQEAFVYNHQPPLPSFSAEAEEFNDVHQSTISALIQKETHDAAGVEADVNLADDDQPMFLYHH